MIPVLTTERLRLRAPKRADFPAYAAFWASDRSRLEDGPRGTVAAWEDFAALFGLWTIEGIGSWAVERLSDGAFVGIVGLNHPVHFPEVEIGWTLTEEAEGNGYATEAARAVLGWSWANTALASLVVYTHPDNHRSIRVGERLGGRRDATARGANAADVVLRIPRPEEAAA